MWLYPLASSLASSGNHPGGYISWMLSSSSPVSGIPIESSADLSDAASADLSATTPSTTPWYAEFIAWESLVFECCSEEAGPDESLV